VVVVVSQGKEKVVGQREVLVAMPPACIIIIISSPNMYGPKFLMN
jgi:hypothetical protein